MYHGYCGIDNYHAACELFELLTERMAKDDCPFTAVQCMNEDAWLAERKFGASEAATILGLTDQWKTRRQLFDEKTGRVKKPEGGDDNPLFRFGHTAEPLIRQLYALEHPEYDVYDGTWIVFRSKAHPEMTASLDMVIKERATGKIYIGEIKTAIWTNKWKGEFCPDNYFAQLCHQLAVTGFDGAMLIARIRSSQMEIDRTANERTYFFTKDNPAVKDNVRFVTDKVTAFAQDCAAGKFSPALSI